MSLDFPLTVEVTNVTLAVTVADSTPALEVAVFPAVRGGVGYRGLIYLQPTGGDDTAQIRAALTTQAVTGRQIFLGYGQSYTITDSIITSLDNICIWGIDCEIHQTTPNKGFIQSRGNNGWYESFTFICDWTRPDLDTLPSNHILKSQYRGVSYTHSVSALWLEGGGNVMKGVRAVNCYDLVHFRGPVTWNPAGIGYTGAETDPITAYFYHTLVDDNQLTDCSATSCDFGITGMQQHRAVWRGFRYRQGTALSGAGVPTHAIYFRAHGTVTDGSLVRSKNIKISDFSADYQPDGVLMKIFDSEDVLVSDYSASDGAGGLYFDNCVDPLAAAIQILDHTGDYGVLFRNCVGGMVSHSQITLAQGNDGAAVTVELGSTRITAANLRVRTRYSTGGGGTPFAANGHTTLGASELTVINPDVFAENEVDNPVFITRNGGNNGGVMRVINPRVRGKHTSRLFNNGSHGTMNVTYNDADFEVFNPAGNGGLGSYSQPTDAATWTQGALINKFPAQQVETGTQHNITLSGNTAAGTYTYSKNFALLDRSERSVNAFLNMVWTARSVSATGTMELSGLPFPRSASPDVMLFYLTVWTYSGITVPAGAQLVLVFSRLDSDKPRFQTIIGGVGTYLDASAFASAGSFYASGRYLSDDSSFATIS